MLRMLGMELHPAARIAIGAVVVAIGLMRGNAAPMVVVGGALVVWGLVAWAGRAERR